MPKSKHKALIDSLKTKFPHLKKEIQDSARGIYDAQRISDACAAGTMKFEKGQAALTNLAKSGAIPAQVGKWLLQTLDPPPRGKKPDWRFVIKEDAEINFCLRIKKREISIDEVARRLFAIHGHLATEYLDYTLENVKKVVKKTCEEVPKLKVQGMPRKHKIEIVGGAAPVPLRSPEETIAGIPEEGPAEPLPERGTVRRAAGTGKPRRDQRL